MKIALAADHGGVDFKDQLKTVLEGQGHEIEDHGTDSKDSCDYPDYGIPAAKSVSSGGCERAILICTNGLGMSMVANKINGVKAALVYNNRTAEATRRHHDSNVLCLGAQEFTENELLEMVNIWLETEFDGGRHQRRVDKFPKV